MFFLLMVDCSFRSMKRRMGGRLQDIYFVGLFPLSFRRASASRHGPNDQKRFGTPDDRLWQQGLLRRFEGQVFFAGEESNERPALERVVVANRPAQHRITRFERVEERAQRNR